MTGNLTETMTDFLARGKALLGIAHGSRAFSGPFQAEFMLTSRCNVRCIHCYFHSPLIDRPNFRGVRLKRMKSVGNADQKVGDLFNKDLDSRALSRLIDDILASGTSQVLFSGFGEPFLHPDILKFMAQVKGADRGALVNTNGTLLTRPVLDELIRLKVDELRITTMAGDWKTWVRTHPGSGREMFEKIRTNLLYLNERKRTLRVRRPKVTLVMVVCDRNIEGLSSFLSFAEEVHADCILFRPVDDIEDPGLEQLVPDAGRAEAFQYELLRAVPRVETAGIDHNIGYFSRIFHRQVDTRGLYRVIPCYYGWLATIIDVDGSVFPCCRCYSSMGNAFDQEFGPLWHGERYREFRKQAGRINKRDGMPLAGCDCNSCVNYTANIKVFRMLHPVVFRNNPILNNEIFENRRMD